MLTFGKAACGTGGSYCCIGCLGVTESCDLTLIGKGICVAGTDVVISVTNLCTGSILSRYESNALVIYDLNRVEVVIAVYGSNLESGVLKSNISMEFCGNFIATVKLVGCVTGIAVDLNNSACLEKKVEGAVLNLRVVSAVITDLNAGEVNDGILVVTLGTEVDGSILVDGSVNVFLKADTLEVCLGISSLCIRNDNYLCILDYEELKIACHILLHAVNVNVEYAVAYAVTGNSYCSISRNDKLDRRISSELMRIAVISEGAGMTDLAACKSSRQAFCSCKVKAVGKLCLSKNCIATCALAVFPGVRSLSLCCYFATNRTGNRSSAIAVICLGRVILEGTNRIALFPGHMVAETIGPAGCDVR